MHLKIFKEDVIDGLQKAATILPQRTGAAYLRSIWLKAEHNSLELLSTDSNIEFRGKYTAEVLQEGLVGVQGRSFVELLRRLPSGVISLTVDEEASVLRIEQGRRKYKLPTNDASWFQNFADFPDEGSIMWSGDFLQELIDKIIFCIGDETSDSLGCFFMKPGENESIEAAGMNGHQFAMWRFMNDDLRALLPGEGILIQKKYLNELKKWLGTEEIHVNISEKRFFARTENKAESLSLPLSSYSYPDYTVFLSRLREQNVSTLLLDRVEAQDALLRIAIFNSDVNRCTYFELSPSEALLTAAGQDTGSAVESLDVEYKGSIEKIAFPTSNLLSIMDHYTSSKLLLTLTGNEGPCGIGGQEDPDYLVIIMPMKILEDVNFSEEQV